MIRALRKRHRRTFIVLGIVLLVVLMWALGSRPEWPQEHIPQNRAPESSVAVEPG